MPAPASPGRSSAPPVGGRFFVGWVYGPWVAALLLLITAARMMISHDGVLQTSAIGLIGNAAICFSIGCVCKVSWDISRFNTGRSPQGPRR